MRTRTTQPDSLQLRRRVRGKFQFPLCHCLVTRFRYLVAQSRQVLLPPTFGRILAPVVVFVVGDQHLQHWRDRKPDGLPKNGPDFGKYFERADPPVRDSGRGPKPWTQDLGDVVLHFDGYWVWVRPKERGSHHVSGKYLFFSKDTEKLKEIALAEIRTHGFHQAKYNTEPLVGQTESVLCLYYSDESRQHEVAKRARAYGVKYRYWKSDADTAAGRYSERFLSKLSPPDRERLTGLAAKQGKRTAGKSPKRGPSPVGSGPLRVLTLPIELVPAPLWNRSLAQLSRDADGAALWKRIRDAELGRSRWRCEACGESGQQVHEKWEYDDDRLVQKLVGLEVLCRECHLVHHQGFAAVHHLDDVAFKQFRRVNALSKPEAKKLEQEAFDLWTIRSARGPWTQDFSMLTATSRRYGFEVERVESILKSLDEVFEEYRWSELRNVPNVGPLRSEALEILGIHTVADLAASDPDDLRAKVASLATPDWSFVSQVPLLIAYSKAARKGEPMVVSHEPVLLGLDESRILFVDFEYDPVDASIFLIGTMTMDGRVIQDFIEKANELPRALKRFLNRVKRGNLTCVSYGSTSADVPMMRRASSNANLSPSLVDAAPFLDLFRDVIFTQNARRQWVFLPLKPMDAKTVAHYFGYDAPGNLSVHDGLEALFRYKEYLRTHSSRTKKQLLRYNESDLKLTRRIFEELRNLEAGRGDVARYRLDASGRA